MSKPSISELRKQIEELEANAATLRTQAEAIRQEERAAAIPEILAKISEYGITAKDLGLTTGPRSQSKVKRAPASKEGARLYKGPAGEIWTSKSRGRKPRWLSAALAEGKTLEQLEVKGVD